MVMRKLTVSVVILLGLACFSAPLLAAQTLWVVTSKEKLDTRISQELERLAREHRARIRFVRQEAEETPPRERRGVLNIELEQAEGLQAFQQTLAKLTQKPATEITPVLARQGYTLDATAVYPSPPHRVQITAATAAGFHYALLRLPDLLRRTRGKAAREFFPAPEMQALTESGRNSLLILADFPSFPERGIVEGFYGKPWSHQDRLGMLHFEGQHRMNVYYYAPKDDPYHRKLWREPYPPARLRQLHQLVEAAHENFVDFCFAVSPGLSMVYSSDEDFHSLTDKLDSVSRLGISCFALFLDDVPPVLENPADVARYKTLAAAHVDVINRLNRYLKSQSAENHLVVTPTTYTNAWGSRDYIRELGAGVAPDVQIVWTGTDVVTPAITAGQAREWGALLKRKPLVWDNFPVNDGIPWRLNLGPLRGRAADLPSAVSGYFSNPMIQAQASKIPLQTAAEYLWNANHYDPDAAWQRALRDQYGREAPMQLAAFLSTYGDYWWDENIFQPLFRERRSTFDTREIERRITLLTRSLAALRRHAVYRRLVREIAPFPPKTRTRLVEVLADPAFEHLPEGKLRRREDYDPLQAAYVMQPFSLDGDFGKWEKGRVYSLDSRQQLFAGGRLWRGPGHFSARFALGWDKNFLYIGWDVTDPGLYQPFTGRDIAKGDVVALVLETAFQKNFLSTRADGDEYDLLFSPGNFQGIAPDVFSEEDYLPPRPVPHDYSKEIKTVWKKTANGFSGDIALPAWWFEGKKFHQGYSIGLAVSAQKVLAPPSGVPPEEENLKRMVFRSKEDHVFPVRFGNPSSYPRLVLTGGPRQP
jgi:beta-N-acetylglucosaminidase